MSTDRPSPETRLAKGPGHDESSGAIGPAIQPSTTFVRTGDYELPGDHIYARYGSPTLDAVERLIADLEGGADTALFSSGLAGAAALFETVPAGGRVVAPRMMYHGGQDWLRRMEERGRIALTLVDDADPDGIGAALAEPADLVWIECPVNPTWDVPDIAAIADVVHAHDALLAVDATGAPPVTMRALSLGADYAFHSATKYFNGHSDVLAGIVTAAHADDRWQEVRSIRKLSGGVLGPFDAWLLQRGMRTMHLRYERSSRNAMAIAEYLESHSAVERVMYPGLSSHPHHELAARQMTAGFGGMLSVLLAGGADAAARVVREVGVFLPATSLGGVESLIEHRAVVEGPHSIVPDNLLRISVGIENEAELIADLDRALSAG